MPQATQQTSTPPSDVSANDLAAQIRAQVNQQIRAQVHQQLKQAGHSEQAAKSAADAAAQPGAPIAPLAPLAPIAVQETGTSVPSDPPLDIPPRVENLGYGLFLMIAVIAVGKPLARAFGSIIERRALRPAMPTDFGARLERIEQGIESVSIEVERISESQRYLLKVQTPDRVEIPRSAG